MVRSLKASLKFSSFTFAMLFLWAGVVTAQDPKPKEKDTPPPPKVEVTPGAPGGAGSPPGPVTPSGGGPPNDERACRCLLQDKECIPAGAACIINTSALNQMMTTCSRCVELPQKGCTVDHDSCVQKSFFELLPKEQQTDDLKKGVCPGTPAGRNCGSLSTVEVFQACGRRGGQCVPLKKRVDKSCITSPGLDGFSVTTDDCNGHTDLRSCSGAGCKGYRLLAGAGCVRDTTERSSGCAYVRVPPAATPTVPPSPSATAGR